MADQHIDTVDLTIVVFEAEDLPGVWIGHCLTLDVVSQGNTREEAFIAVSEAIHLVLKWDRQAGLDPFRRIAPADQWTHASPMRAIPPPGLFMEKH